MSNNSFGLTGIGGNVLLGRRGNRIKNSANSIDFRDTNDSAFLNVKVAAPTLDDHAATKLYVDNVAQGLDTKESVRVATLVNAPLISGYENLDVIDGITLATGDRILIKNQTLAKDNGIYTVNATGAPTRAIDADNSPANEVNAGMYCFVEAGTQSDTGWLLQDLPFTGPGGQANLGTDALNFTQFNGAGNVIAGSGMTKSGNTLNVIGGNGITANANDLSLTINSTAGLISNAGVGTDELAINLATASALSTSANELKVSVDNSSIAIVGNSLEIKSTYVGQTSLTTLGTVTTGTWNGSIIDHARGGHNANVSAFATDSLYLHNGAGDTELAKGGNNTILGVNGAGVLGYAQLNLAAQATGVLGTANGGTGSDLSGVTGLGTLFVSDATGNMKALSIAALGADAGKVLKVNNAGTDFVFGAPQNNLVDVDGNTAIDVDTTNDGLTNTIEMTTNGKLAVRIEAGVALDDTTLTMASETGGFGIGVDSVAVNADINFTPKGTGTLTVPVGYEANVISNTDLTNKKYVDDTVATAIAGGDLTRIKDVANKTYVDVDEVAKSIISGAENSAAVSKVALETRISGTTTGNEHLVIEAGDNEGIITAEGTAANIDIRLTPKGTGTVIIGDTTSAGVITGGNSSTGNAQSMTLSGGNSTFLTGLGGDVNIIAGEGDTTNDNGVVTIFSRDAGVNNEVAEFSGVTGGDEFISISNGTAGSGATIATKGTAANVDMILDPKGTGAIIVRGDIDMEANTIKTTTVNGDIKLLPNGTGAVSVAIAGYENNVTDNNDLTNKKYVDDKIISQAAALLQNGVRRGVVTADSLASSFTVDTDVIPTVIGKNTYVNRVSINIDTIFAGNSVDGLKISDGTTSLTVALDSDILVAGAYIVELPLTVNSEGGTLTANFVNAGGTAAIPTSGSATIACQFNIV